MVVRLKYTNNLPIPVMLLNNMGTGQPLAPRQELEMTFELREDSDGVTDLVLICNPQQPS